MHCSISTLQLAFLLMRFLQCTIANWGFDAHRPNYFIWDRNIVSDIQNTNTETHMKHCSERQREKEKRHKWHQEDVTKKDRESNDTVPLNVGNLVFSLPETIDRHSAGLRCESNQILLTKHWMRLTTHTHTHVYGSLNRQITTEHLLRFEFNSKLAMAIRIPYNNQHFHVDAAFIYVVNN